MTHTRLIVVLLGALGVMLSVVILRTETARLERKTAQQELRRELLRGQLREEELELARLRNPALIRARAAEMRLTGATEAPERKPGR